MDTMMMTPLVCLVLGFLNPDVDATIELPAVLTSVNEEEFTFTFDPAASSDELSLSLMQDEAPGQAFGLAGSTYWLANIAGASSFKDNHHVRGGIGISHFLADDFSIDFELNLGYFPQEGDDALGGNFNILLRWHFWHDESRSWTVYFDGGAGMLLTSDDVPFDGSSFNFTPQFGIGASFDLGDDTRLYFGGRWFHVSNARLYDANPGADYAMLYVMLGWPF